MTFLTPHSSLRASDARPYPARWKLAGLSLCVLLASLSTSIANVALPTLATTFKAPFAQVQWVVLAYLLGMTVLVISVSRLGDRLGRRRLLIIGLATFVAASLACGAAPGLALLVAARGVQGLGAAVMIVLAMAMVGETASKGRVGSAVGLLGTMSAVGTAMGPSLGGLLIEFVGWRAIFFACAALGALALYIIQRFVVAGSPPSPARSRFDLWGTVLLALALTAYALATTLGDGGSATIGLLVLATAAGAVFLFVETKTAAPLVRPAMFRDITLATGLSANLLISAVMMSTLVVSPFYLSLGLDLDAAAVGATMSVGPLIAALTGAPAGRLTDRFGARRLTLAGLIVMGLGAVALCALPATAGVAGYLAGIGLLTAGYAAFQAANNTAVLTSGAPDQRNLISGMLTLTRNLGLITGASVMGATFAMACGGSVLGAGSQAVSGGIRTTFAVAAALIVISVTIVLAGRKGGAPALRPAP